MTDGCVLPSKKIKLGGLHPISLMSEKIIRILQSIGFVFFDSPEVDSVENNFTLLNIPNNHPARSPHDTFYLNNTTVLRTHTSNIQIKVLKQYSNKELKVCTSGKVYRRDDDDASHSHQFTQLEGFLVGKGVSMVHLKGVLEFLLNGLFDKDNSCIYRFRPSYFPFTNPSIEVDIRCTRCVSHEEIGCAVCKYSGWVEVLGAGLIHPSVLINCGFDVKKYSGLAFGMGIERLLMVKYGIDDIRCFYNNNLRFLDQFNHFNF